MKTHPKTRSPLIPILIASLLSACSTTPKSEQLLPDSGPTTLELLGVGSESGDYYGNGVRADYLGTPLVSAYAPNNNYSFAHVDELRRDFHQVPNPQIVAYVYPHLTGDDMPVPGYYTMFNLYDQNHYALSSEGHHEAQ